MKTNLDTLRGEIQDYLESHGIAVFHGTPRGAEETGMVYWDVERHPDYRAYLAAAEAAGARVVTIFANEFNQEVIDDAQERLEESSLTREERRAIEQRLREMRAFAGFTCQIELSFDIAPRVYIFDLRTEWFEDLSDLLYRIDDAYDTEDEDDEPLGGGYFSKN
ncbi:MAG: hypothetical protein LAO79_13375 [Acidobacteriia bacterium]|nr:hypothetical protein [Terriglobia bacterium]